MIQLDYDQGSVLIRGATGTPYGRWDPRVQAFRALGIDYSTICAYLTQSELAFTDRVAEPLLLPPLTLDLALRPYQSAALNAWIAAGYRGVIELPTGAGKTYIALHALAQLNEATLIIVPTLDLVEQWRRQLMELFPVEVGVIGGGDVEVRAITVATYDSAYLRAEQLGNRFLLLVFDEVHHLPAPSYRQIAEMYIAPHRMGLTATYVREDGAHQELPRLVGSRVYQRAVDDLTGTHLAPYTLEKQFVDLTSEEQAQYTHAYGAFTRYLHGKGLRLRSPRDFHRFIMSTGTSPAARRALLARNRAVEIALNAQGKLQRLGELVALFPEEKLLIFTRHNALVYRISRRFLIPAITHQSGKAERRAVLDRFRAGLYRAIVTSQVLDEGIDVPDASVAVIISGTGSSREYIQRLGRILRKRTGKQARLIELVTRDTVETRISTRRHR